MRPHATAAPALDAWRSFDGIGAPEVSDAFGVDGDAVSAVGSSATDVVAGGAIWSPGAAGGGSVPWQAAAAPKTTTAAVSFATGLRFLFSLSARQFARRSTPESTSMLVRIEEVWGPNA